MSTPSKPLWFGKRETIMTTTPIKPARGIVAELRNAALKGYRRAMPVVLGGLMLAACSDAQDVKTAQEDVVHFHEMMSAGQVEQIYAETDDAFKKAMTEADWKRMMSFVIRRLGAVKTSESPGSITNFGTAGTFITMAYKTQFEHGTGTEKFVYRVADGKVLLAGYHVDSNAFLAMD